MAEEKDGYILDVIANLQKSLTNAQSGKDYFREVNEGLRKDIEEWEQTMTAFSTNLHEATQTILEQEEKLKEIPKLKEMNKELLENITILRQALQNKIEAQDALAAKCNEKNV